MKNTFALLGLGRHADKTIIPAFNNSKVAEIIKIGSNKNYLENTISYENAATSNQIENVYICLPNALHLEWCIKSLQAGKNIICEKPLCCSLEETKLVIESQKASNKKLLEAFMYRYHPQHKIVKTLLEQKIIGDLKLFEAHFHYFLDDFENIRMNKDLGGGSILDVGCYLVDACLFLFEDKFESISGNWIINKKSNVDDFANATIKFNSGMIANLTCGSRMNRQSSYTIYGELGKIHVRDAFKIPKNKKGLIVLEKVDGSRQEIFSEPADHYQLMIDHFCTSHQNDINLILRRAELLESWKRSCLSS